jgi:hypothetical protein
MGMNTTPAQTGIHVGSIRLLKFGKVQARHIAPDGKRYKALPYSLVNSRLTCGWLKQEGSKLTPNGHHHAGKGKCKPRVK